MRSHKLRVATVRQVLVVSVVVTVLRVRSMANVVRVAVVTVLHVLSTATVVKVLQPLATVVRQAAHHVVLPTHNILISVR
jgi:hypothetical protein